MGGLLVLVGMLLLALVDVPRRAYYAVALRVGHVHREGGSSTGGEPLWIFRTDVSGTRTFRHR